MRALSEALRASGYACSVRLLELPPRALGAEGLAEDGFAAALARVLADEAPDLVFCPFYEPALYAELGSIGLPVVGSPAQALELVRSKSRLKRLWDAKGIATPSYFCVRRTRTGSIAGRRLIAGAADFPYIVKPDGEDEHRGIHAFSIAFDSGALASSIDAALAEYDELLIEHFVGGKGAREFTVAMIGNGKEALFLPAEIHLKEDRPIRVVTREDRLKGLAAAEPVGGELALRLADFARRALTVAPLRDYARCDIIEEGGALFALEANGQPRIPDPWFEACAAGGGLGSADYVAAIFRAASERAASAR